MRIQLLLSLLVPVCAALAAEPPSPSFKTVDVDTKVEIGYGVTVADVNGDKKPDILLADKNLIVWYENPSWAKHVMAEKLTTLDHVCIAAQDIDGDGKCEVAVGAGWNPGDTLNSGAVFYLLPPADRTQKWEPVTLPHEPTVHRMRWVKNADGGYDLVVAPLHGRGNKPTGEGDGAKVMRYRKPANAKDPWKTDVLDESMHKTHNFDPIQWDADTAQEMLIAGKEGVFLFNPGTGKATMTQLSGTESGGAGEVRAGQLGGGKRFFATVEPMHGTNLVVYTRPPLPPPAQSLWNRHVLDESLVDGHALACGDLSGIGRDQIVVGWRAMGKPGVKVGIKLFTPVDADGKNWRQTLVDDNTMACEDLCLADLDGDGKLDIVAAGRATKNLKVYFNQGASR
jgi:Aldos-2-ulose dehydratase, beta-propeller domain